MFNPKLKDFIQDNKDLTVVGLYWAGAWRFMVYYFAIVLGILAVAKLLS